MNRNFILWGFFLLISWGQNLFAQDIEMPYFKGCDTYPNYSEEKRNCSNQQLVKFIAENLRYPKAAIDQEIEGTVYINFKVNEKGRVHSAKILNDIGGDCEQEALRVVYIMPMWEAAQDENGNPTEVELNLPVQFALKNAELYSEKHIINWGALTESKVSIRSIKANLYAKIVVRDELGNDYEISNLTIAYQKGRTFLEENSRGVITNDMRKLLSKIKEGGQLLITTTIVDDGDFIDVARLFDVI